MVVTVEISGVLEEKLRRLVDLGVYSSVAEAVRDAVRNMLSSTDMREIALKIYTTKNASFQYATYFAEETFDSMIEYMLSKEVVPLIGVLDRKDVEILDKGVYLVDPLTIHILYKSELADIATKSRNGGIKMLTPEKSRSYIQIAEARRIWRGMDPVRIVATAPIPVPSEMPRSLITVIEEAIINYADATDTMIISDDARTRLIARERGVEAVSSLSILLTGMEEGIIDPVRASEVIYGLRMIPYLLPDHIVGELVK
ncbi:MAG: hypothetical protein GSR85_05085 [Desulfurococcales archaeon]|nr:hypothetical protein [Desulfurococcales archaeon]